MKSIVIYVHGKGGNAAEAEHYKPLFPASEVVGFDYKSETPWEAEKEFPAYFENARKITTRLSLSRTVSARFSVLIRLIKA